jgi:hypothetical protein
MELKFPKIAIRTLDVSEYHPDYKAVLHVWCNPPNGVVVEHYEKAVEEYRDDKPDKMISWASLMWSKGAEDTHVSEVEVKRMIDEMQETDPLLFTWMINKTLDIVRDHRLAKKKQ